MNLAINDKSIFQVKALANNNIQEIAQLLDNSAYGMQYKLMIADFYERPEDFKIVTSPSIPDGSPIGSDSCNYLKY